MKPSANSKPANPKKKKVKPKRLMSSVNIDKVVANTNKISQTISVKKKKK
jgi:hypothetical protein